MTRNKGIKIFSRTVVDGDSIFNKREFFFTTNYLQSMPDWGSAALYFPTIVAPRPGLEDGCVDSVEKLIFVHSSHDILIPNPREEYDDKVLYDRFSMLHNNKTICRVPDDYNERDYPGRSELTEVERKILALWEPEQIIPDAKLKEIYDFHNAKFMEKCRSDLFHLEARIRGL